MCYYLAATTWHLLLLCYPLSPVPCYDMTYYLTLAPHYNMSYYLPPDILILDLWLSHSRESCRVILYYIYSDLNLWYLCTPEFLIMSYSCYSRKLIITYSIIRRQLAPGSGETDWPWIVMFMVVLSRHAWPHTWGITWRPPGISLGVLAPLLLFIPAEYAHALGLFLWDLRYSIPVRAYNKSQYLAVHSGSAPDTPGPLSRACTGPFLCMVRRSPSVSK